VPLADSNVLPRGHSIIMSRLGWGRGLSGVTGGGGGGVNLMRTYAHGL
jgi:hypothetical protein